MDIRHVQAPFTSASPRSVENHAGMDGLLGAETTPLEALVHHRRFVEQDLPLEQVQREFSDSGLEYLALVRADRVVGLCSRLRLGILLGTRFGFALHSRSPAYLAQVEHPLVFSPKIPVRTVLDQSLARYGDEFREDVVLVDEQHHLIGLIPVDALARLQSRLVSEQVAELRRRHLELFQTNHALRQSQGLYLGLFDTHPLGIALMDRYGTIHEHNRRLTELLNLPAAKSTPLSLASRLSGADQSNFAELLHRLANGAPVIPTASEYHFSVPGRGLRLFRLSPGWIRETGQICLCVEDITEQRTMERHLVRQEKQTLLDTLVGGIAHELNNKLTPVQGFSELIRLNAEPQTQFYAGLITKSVTEAATIIRQLLQLSKPVQTSVALVDLCQVVDEALAMLRFKVRETRCTLRTLVPPTPIWVRADASQLKQVVLNLSLNALDALIDRKPAHLSIEIRTDQRLATMVVADTGAGIPPENLGRIFDPFYTTKGPERGTGLGLSICFSIVRQHGGEITVESLVNQGTTFHVSLPLDTTTPMPFELTDLPSSTTATSRKSTGARVLVVDDELIVQRLMQEILTVQLGCQVDVATNGVEALELLTSARYTFVVSDIRMAGMNGTELFLWLREAQPALARRLVFVTGHAGERHLEEEIAAWGVPMLMKPFTVERFVELCAPFLEFTPEALRTDPL